MLVRLFQLQNDSNKVERMTWGRQLWRNEDGECSARKIVSRFQMSTRLCIINSDCLMYAARVHARRRETRSGKDITGLSRTTRRTGPQTGIIRRARLACIIYTGACACAKTGALHLSRQNRRDSSLAPRNSFHGMQLFPDGYWFMLQPLSGRGKGPLQQRWAMSVKNVTCVSN